MYSLQWRHNGRDGVSNHQPHDCLHNRLFGCRSKKTSKPRFTGLCGGNSPGTGEFPAQTASKAESVSIWWRHHVYLLSKCSSLFQGELVKNINRDRNANHAMLASWDENFFRVTEPLWGESISHQCIILKKCQWCGALVPTQAVEQTVEIWMVWDETVGSTSHITLMTDFLSHECQGFFLSS